jgi:hypothetical protein
MMPAEIQAVLAGERRFAIANADCLDVLRAMPDNCVDFLVCDPPAGVSFMNMAFDSDRGGRHQWIAWLAERMREALRVMKPGAHGLVWSLPRTSHWTGTALEDAGFEVRDRLAAVFGSGFPKSMNVSKAIEATILTGGSAPKDLADAVDATGQGVAAASGTLGLKWDRSDGTKQGVPRHASGSWTATTEEAKRWQGWGTALKPAVEDWWLVRKPMRQSIAKNALEYGTGALNIDACRVPHASAADLEQHAAGVAAIKERGGSMDNSWKNSSDLAGASDVSAAGRWPSHLLLSHAPGCERAGTKRVKAAPSWNDNRGPSLFSGEATSPVHHTDGDGFETVDAWTCVDGCPVKLLDEQSGSSLSTTASGLQRYGRSAGIMGNRWRVTQTEGHDEGGASRYFKTFAPEQETEWESEDLSPNEPTDATSHERDTCAVTTADECGSSTTSCGKSATAPSRKASRSTTRTRTSKITDSTTSNSSTPQPTSGSTADENSETASGGSRASCAAGSSQSTGSIGTCPKRDGLSTGDVDRATSELSANGVAAPPFVYLPKASRSDREGGCEHLPRKSGGEATGRQDGTAGLNSPRAGGGRLGGRANDHPTPKNVDLMRYLCRLIGPPNGICLDIFMGSGSTGKACSAEGFRFIGVEIDAHYCDIARARIAGENPLFNREVAG